MVIINYDSIPRESVHFCFVSNSPILTKQELSIKIGKRIKQLRKERNISQAELGRMCERDKQHIELIENHKVSANTYTLYTIAFALGVELKELFDFK